MRSYYFVFEYTDPITNIDQKVSHVAQHTDYLKLGHALEICAKKYHRWIITFFTEIPQEQYDDYISYVDTL